MIIDILLFSCVEVHVPSSLHVLYARMVENVDNKKKKKNKAWY